MICRATHGPGAAASSPTPNKPRNALPALDGGGHGPTEMASRAVKRRAWLRPVERSTRLSGPRPTDMGIRLSARCARWRPGKRHRIGTTPGQRPTRAPIFGLWAVPQPPAVELPDRVFWALGWAVVQPNRSEIRPSSHRSRQIPRRGRTNRPRVDAQPGHVALREPRTDQASRHPTHHRDRDDHHPPQRSSSPALSNPQKPAAQPAP
jgi:hypothetical protein